ncbi:hypothetical protein SASPL_135879 [Salvia splendens]|uniref:Uncharacterized protein n=1 Tax=Salvia splendens TaxID=180675 RepID=A0A8X8X117_SALSN|nr:hypothetical protein SASPL_135879 [Salvia splendens]
MKKAEAATNILEAIAQLSSREAAEGPKKMKIVVKKEELKQVLEAISRQRRSTSVRRGPAPPMSLEQRLNFMRRRQILRAAARTRSGSWRPALQSIPEEF